MYWCCSVTMQIDRRINSTTDQREKERKVKSVGHPFAAAGIGFRSVPLTAAYCRLLTHWLDATLRRDCLASERELICGG